MINARVKVALISDHNYWCFARLVPSNLVTRESGSALRRNSRRNQHPQPAEILLLSDVYSHTGIEPPIIGTIVALLVDSMGDVIGDVDFRLDFTTTIV